MTDIPEAASPSFKNEDNSIGEQDKGIKNSLKKSENTPCTKQDINVENQRNGKNANNVKIVDFLENPTLLQKSTPMQIQIIPLNPQNSTNESDPYYIKEDSKNEEENMLDFIEKNDFNNGSSNQETDDKSKKKSSLKNIEPEAILDKTKPNTVNVMYINKHALKNCNFIKENNIQLAFISNINLNKINVKKNQY